MTYNALIAEIAQHPVDERLSLLAALSRTLGADLSPSTSHVDQHGHLPGSDLGFPDDPALAALEAQFE